MKIKQANIYLNDQQNPVSTDFEDVYFSDENGVAETDYVFIQGNDLLYRWLHCCETDFCIAETGFGTGLNFFRVCQFFVQFRLNNPQHILKNLYFISCEKFPLSKNDANAVIQNWTSQDFLTIPSDYRPLIDKFTQAIFQYWLKNYPQPVSGVQRNVFNKLNVGSVHGRPNKNTNNDEHEAQFNIVLDLHYMDASESYSEIKCDIDGLVDAWFLDGFAPSKNNSMWQASLYSQMARISKKDATFATFTAAGAVRRGLIDAGFNAIKRKGFGRKREMLVGNFASDIANKSPVEKQHARYFTRTGITPPTLNFRPQENTYNAINSQSIGNELPITVVGSGLAGAISALKLVQQGKQVELIWQGSLLADGASGNPIGGFYPQLNAQNNFASQLQLQSFLYARQFYQHLHNDSPFEHNWCGALQLGFNENTQNRLQKLSRLQLWPEQIAVQVNATQASKIANIDIPYDCLHIPLAGWISPPSITKACINQALKSNLLTIIPNTHLAAYTCLENNVIELHLIDKTKTKVKKITSALVLGTGEGSHTLLSDRIPFRLTRGQVEHIATTPALNTLQTLLCHKGYFTPSMHGFHAMGSTYVKNDRCTKVRINETNDNYKTQASSLRKVNWLKQLTNTQTQTLNTARAAIRCSTPDHLPIVGNVPHISQFTELKDLYKAKAYASYPSGKNDPNVFVLSGLGSRGLTTAPLMAEILVSQMLGQVMPLSSTLLNAINPNRFIIRSLIKRLPFD